MCEIGQGGAEEALCHSAICKSLQARILQRQDYLGYRILHEGVEMDPEEVQAVLEWGKNPSRYPEAAPELPRVCQLLPSIHPILHSNSILHHYPLKDQRRGKIQTKPISQVVNGMPSGCRET